MSTDSGASESSASPKGIRMVHAIYSEQDSLFRATAVSKEFLKANQKYLGVQCVYRVLQFAISVRVSGIAQRRLTHKPTCHADERSSGLFKLVRMFSANPVLMGYLKIGIVFECGLLDNPRIGFDTPFLARIEIAIEPSEVLNFGGLYVNDPTVEERLEGMLQVNAITAWQSPSMQAPLTPKRLNTLLKG